MNLGELFIFLLYSNIFELQLCVQEEKATFLRYPIVLCAKPSVLYYCFTDASHCTVQHGEEISEEHQVVRAIF